jgi:hypothetical protein
MEMSSLYFLIDPHIFKKGYYTSFWQYTNRKILPIFYAFDLYDNKSLSFIPCHPVLRKKAAF